MGMGGRGVVRMGLLGRSGAGSCPNLLQRRPAAGSAAGRSAEYQRFSFGAPARSGPLQQIWTTCAVAGPWEGRRGPGGGRGGRPPGAETCTSHSKVQFQPSFSRTKCTSRRRSGPVAVVADRGADPAPEHLRRPDEKGSAVLLEDDAQRAPQDLLPGPCGCIAHWRTAPCGPVESFPHDSAVLPRMSIFSGRAPMCRGGRSAHRRISMALNAEVFPHDSADLPRAGPGRMCSAAPTVPRTAHWARHRRPDTPDPAARATTPRGSPEKPRPGVRPRRRPHLTTPNPASEPRRLLGGRWCGGGGASLSVVAIPAGPQAGSWRRSPAWTT